MIRPQMTKGEYAKFQELQARLDAGEQLNDEDRKVFNHLERKLRQVELAAQAEKLAEALRGSVGQWMRDDWDEEQLAGSLLDLVNDSADEISQVKVALRERLNTQDGEALKKQLVWLDAMGERMGEIKANATMLKELATKIFFIPQGSMRPATLEDGTFYIDPKLQPKPTQQDPEPEPVLKYEKLTDMDRKILLDAKLVPYVRFEAEMDNLLERIKNRHFLGQRILDDLERMRRSGI